MDLDEYASHRDVLLQKITEALEADQRVRAAWLSGSFGRGEQDEWSDLDVHIVVADEEFPQFLDDRSALYNEADAPLLVQSDMESDSQLGARFQLVVYPGPVEVDWNIGPESVAVRPLHFTMLLERSEVPVVQIAPLTPADRRARAEHWLTFFWAMAPIAIKLCGRGDTRRAVKQLDLLTTAYIALWRLTSAPRGPSWIPSSANPVLEPALHATIPVTGPTITPHDALTINAALCERVQELHPKLECLGVAVPEEMIVQVARLHTTAAQLLARGPVQPPRYR